MGRTTPNAEESERRKQSRWGFRGMTVRDWLQLLIVPLALVLISFLFTAQQDQRQQSIEDQRAKSEREIEEQRAQDTALQAYLDQMSTLLLEKDLRNSEADSEMRTLARARTLTVLPRLSSSRKTEVMRFLYEAELVQSGAGGRDPVIRLGGADLRGGDYSNHTLRGVVLIEADLTDAVLIAADLTGANLSHAQGVADDQLAEASSLKGATMPNGQKYEEWLKSKGSGEDGENNGSS